MLCLNSLRRYSEICLCLWAWSQQKAAFPPALTPEEEQALLKKLAAGDDDARDKLIEHNLRLVAHIAKSTRHAAVMRMILSPSGLSDS